MNILFLFVVGLSSLIFPPMILVWLLLFWAWDKWDKRNAA